MEIVSSVAILLILMYGGFWQGAGKGSVRLYCDRILGYEI